MKMEEIMTKSTKMVCKIEKPDFFLFLLDVFRNYVAHYGGVSVFFTKIFFAACSKQYQARACFYHR